MAQTTGKQVPIPEPSSLPFIGHIHHLDLDAPLQSFLALQSQYGEIYRIFLASNSMVFVSTQALVNEICDEKRFQKSIGPVFTEFRRCVGDGLFTAHAYEENWGIAHRILMPAFGPLAIRDMFDSMKDIACQLALKWARHGPQTPIQASEDFTRLALDTIALCSMGYRFNSYYSPELHPFIKAMGEFLIGTGRRIQRPPLPSIFFRREDSKWFKSIEELRRTAGDVLEARKAEGGKIQRKDLLTAMMDGVDPKTGKKMTDQSIIENLITFLVAGHETTAGLLSFAMYQLLKNPRAYAKAQAEVDSVVGKGAITPEHLPKLPYITAILRETLRLDSPITGIGVEALEDTLLAGKYAVKKGEPITALLSRSHLDPAVFGEDVLEFKPERMLEENFKRLNEEFPNCWKPFGNGMRGCIGRPFAWQEALLMFAVMFQNFNFVMDDPKYSLVIKETLTIKPNEGFRIRAILRDSLTPTTLEARLAGHAPAVSDTKLNGHDAGVRNGSASETSEITVLYGSNSGTCESLAQRIATDAPSHGFKVTKLDTLDSARNNLPTNQATVIITSSYEGQPPDNAAHFTTWLENLSKDSQSLKGVSYAVFGCGHKDWVQTFHRVPKLVDNSLEKAGATRLVETGLTDTSSGNAFTDFEAWEDDLLWPALTAMYKPTGSVAVQDAQMEVQVLSPRTEALRQDVRKAVVVEARTLSTGDEIKKHIEIKLPEDMTYTAGDYLAVLAVNPEKIVQRVMRRFGLPWDAHLFIKSQAGRTSLPVNESVPATHVLGSYLELAQPATKRNILTLAESTPDSTAKAALNLLANDHYAEEINSKRTSVLDLLEQYPQIDIDIGTFLSMLPPMRVRQYSISSSPLWNPSNVTLTYSILTAPSLSGQGPFQGVSSTYLSSLSANDTLNVSVRSSQAPFSLPSDPENVPIICIAAGTGIAPFRGFIQERSIMVRSGRKLAAALLFFGCRAPGEDDLYREELDEWEAQGAVQVRRAYSRQSEKSGGCRHVRDRVWSDRKEVIELWRQGAKMFVCGSRVAAEGVKDVVVRIKKEYPALAGSNVELKDPEKWFESLRNIRYVADVFD